MKINLFKSGSIEIAEVSSYQEYQNNKTQYEQFPLIIVKKYSPELVKYPTKIAFRIKIAESLESYLKQFKSSERSSMNKRYKQIKSNYHYRIKPELSSADFQAWFGGYKDFLSSLQYGELKIDAVEFEKLKKRHKAVFIYEKEKQKLMGGVLFKVIQNNGEKKVSISLAWYSEEIRRKGAPTFVVLELIKYCIKNSCNYLSFGVDTNLYGGHLSIGLHDFKASWNSEPYIPKQSKICGLIFNESMLMGRTILFYKIHHNNKLVKCIYGKN